MAALVLLVIVALGGLYFVVAGLNAATTRVSEKLDRNADALSQARLALLGYVAAQALNASENNPGRLPCPEAAGDYGTVNEGRAAGNCTLPAVGRLPWKTLGLDKLTDAAGEPLWYVVSPGWALSNSTTPPLTTYINSNSVGQLGVDGQANAAIALLIAPGPAIEVQAAAGCAARVQARNKLVAPDLRDYLECENASSPADAAFVTTGPASSFNDQVLRVTAADLLPLLEGAIAKRIERDIAPRLASAYTTGNRWYSSSGASPVYPFAAPWGDTSASPTNLFRGQLATYGGLLPTSTLAADPGFVRWEPASSSAWWGWNGTVNWYDCGTYFTTGELRCRVQYDGSPVFEFWALARNVNTTLRTYKPSQIYVTGGGSMSVNWYDGSLNTDDSAWIYAQVALPFQTVGTWRTADFAIPIGFLGDHPVVDPNDATTGWFVRNQWHHVTYYRTSRGYAPDGVGWCLTPPSTPRCVQVQNSASVDGNRAVLVLGGRSLGNMPRPNGTITDYFEGINSDGDALFEVYPASRSFNDRVVFANP